MSKAGALLARTTPTLLVSALLACGGAAPSPEAGTPSEPVASPAKAAPGAPRDGAPGAAADGEAAHAVPTDCKTDGKLCLPPLPFAKTLCAGVHPDVALAFFKKGTPFTRGWLRGNVDAWNASGGVTSSEKLVFDEEVIVLRARKADTGGMQVSGASGGYDVLRWDGTCASLSGDELTFTSPPKSKNAKILWNDLPESTREVLLAETSLKELNAERKRECKGASMGTVSKKCVTLVEKLSDEIAAWVRAGGTVPAPTRLP